MRTPSPRGVFSVGSSRKLNGQLFDLNSCKPALIIMEVIFNVKQIPTLVADSVKIRSLEGCYTSKGGVDLNMDGVVPSLIF